MSARENAPKLVSAGAGSGKTYRIVQTIVERVRAGTSIDRIAAVTFTESAATELQDRVRAGLLAQGLDDEAARVDVAVICTIHRFALTLLQRYPLAAGLPPEPIVLDEAQSSSLRRGLLADVLFHEAPDEAVSTEALLEHFLGPGVGISAQGWGDDTPETRLGRLVGDVLEKARSLAMDADAITREGPVAAERVLSAMGRGTDATALDTALENGLRAAFDWLTKNPEPKRKGDAKLYETLRALRSERAKGDFDTALRIARCDVTKGGEKDFGPVLDAARASVVEHPTLRDRLRAGIVGVFALAGRVLHRYAAEKDRMGAVDFEDMQLVALDLIAGRRAGREAYAGLVARALPFVVVDEFQDTSPLQFRLFEALREAGAEVVYVGDLKQGIYGFRTADSALFAALLERAEREGDAPESLDRSRRSRDELVRFANGLFEATMPPEGIPFAPLTAENAYTRGLCPKDHGSVDVVLHGLRPAEAKLAAGVERLEALIAAKTPVFDRATNAARPARWGDVAVLAYKHATLANWAEALRARGISCVLEARGLFETLEVQLATAWLRMLASPRDRGAAAAVLLSELYGVSQRTMVRLTLAKVSGSPRRALELHHAEPGALPLTDFERRALLRCRDDLEACREALRQLPLPEALERAFERVGLADRLAMRLGGAEAAQVRANLAQLVVIAQQLAGRGDVGLALAGATGVTLENFLLALERAQRDDPWQPLAGDDAPNSVKLVTLHASKGMEYPIVLLDALDTKLEVRLPRVEVVRPEDREAMLGADALAQSGVALVPAVGVDHWSERFRAMFDGEARLRQEWLRLLYVAVTRARDHLVMLWPQESKSGTTAYVRNVLSARVPTPTAGMSTWLGVAVQVFAPAESNDATGDDGDADDGDDEAVSTPAPPLAVWRALAERDGEDGPDVPLHAVVPRLAQVSPSELCQVNDCAEVPRLMRFARGERHELARSTGIPIDTAPIASTWSARVAVPREVPPSRIGTLVHAAVERAPLCTDEGTDASIADAVLDLHGQHEHRAELHALITGTLASLRDAVRALGAVEEPAREVPFVVDVRGATVRGIVDLVVRSREGLHVIDLKTHPLQRPDLSRWAAYYLPQLDAYALALARITGEAVLGRHLAVTAAGALVTVPERFDADVAEASLARLCDTLARGDRGPSQDCVTCHWTDVCRRGKQVLRGVDRRELV